MRITNILYYLLLAIIIVIGIVRYKKLTIPYKILILYVALNLAFEAISVFWANKYKNNMPIMHVASYSEFLLNTLAFYYLFKSHFTKRMIIIGIAVITLFFIINAVVLQPYTNRFPSNSLLISEIFYVVLSLMLFKQMLQYPVQINITRQSVFWYNTGVLFFSTTTFLNFGLINFYVKHHLQATLLYSCSFVLNMVFYLLIGISILLDNKLREANA